MNNKQNNYDSITYISLSFEQYNVFFAFTIKKVGLINSFFNPSRVFNASSLGSGSSIASMVNPHLIRGIDDKTECSVILFNAVHKPFFFSDTYISIVV